MVTSVYRWLSFVSTDLWPWYVRSSAGAAERDRFYELFNLCPARQLTLPLTGNKFSVTRLFIL